MSVNQKTRNLYFSITVTFTLAHLKKTNAPANKFSKKIQKRKYG